MSPERPSGIMSTSITAKNKKTLEVLKKRQQESRRTYSASAILQRSTEENKTSSNHDDNESDDCSNLIMMMRTDFGRRKTSYLTNNSQMKSNEDNKTLISPNVRNSRRHHSLSPKRIMENETKTNMTTEAVSSIVDENKYEKKMIEELTVENMMPCMNPEEVLEEAIENLKSAGRAKRKELDWQEQYEALNQMRRLVKHHGHVMRKSMREVVHGILPAVESLRSSTSKNAIILLQEMFMGLGRELDKDLDEIIPVLLKKAAENSITGY